MELKASLDEQTQLASEMSESAWLPGQMSNVQNPCWLMILGFLGDSTTKYIGDCNDPRTGNPYNPTRIKWNNRGILNTAQISLGFCRVGLDPATGSRIQGEFQTE